MFKTALTNIRRTPYQSLSSIVVLSFNLFVISIFLLVSLASQIILTHFETRPQIIAYLQDGVLESDVNQAISALNATNQVKAIKYVTKQEALSIYKKSVGNDPVLLGTVTDLGEVTADILPASLEISVSSIESFEPIAAVLQNTKIVSVTPQGQKEIDFPKDVLTELVRWTRAIRTAGLILVIVLSLASVVTIGSLLSLKIASRRLEINTMKLIGAKNSFILKPYLAESIIYSFVGSVFSWLLTLIALLYSTPFLASRLIGIITLPVSPLVMIYLLVVILVFSLILGLLSGIFASVRFIKR